MSAAGNAIPMAPDVAAEWAADLRRLAALQAAVTVWLGKRGAVLADVKISEDERACELLLLEQDFAGEVATLL